MPAMKVSLSYVDTDSIISVSSMKSPLGVKMDCEDVLHDEKVDFEDVLHNEKVNVAVILTEPDVSLDADDFPDGGLRAWLVLLGAMCNAFATLGYVTSWGVYQSYYEMHILNHQTSSAISWIGSMQYALVFFPALIVGQLFDRGYFRSIVLPSSVIFIVSVFLIAECTEYWQFILCQGLAVGLSAGCIFGPTSAVVAHWFKKRRGIAMGLLTVGASLGGTLFPILTHNLINIVGFQWTMRIIGFILILFLGPSSLLLKRRLLPKKAPGGIFNLSAFKSAAYSTYCVAAFVTFLGIYTVLTYVNVSARDIGISSNLSFYFVSFANAASLFGRCMAGLMSDKLGSMNVMIPFTVCTAILIFIWPFASSPAALIVLTVLYGFTSGSYISLAANPMINFGGTEDVGRRVGMFFTILSAGALIGPPISGVIKSHTGNFEAVGYFAGSAVFFGVVLIILSRYLVLGKWSGKI